MNPIKKKYTDELCDIILAEIMDFEDTKRPSDEIIEWLKSLLDETERDKLWEK